MKSKFTALLLTMALTLTACTVSEPLEIQPDDTSADTSAPDTEQTEQTENAAEETTATVYATVPTSAYPLVSVPADTKITYEFTEEDRELHEILQDLEPAWKVFGNLITDGLNCIEGYGTGTWVHFSQGAWENDWFYQSLSKDLPFNSIDGLTAEINRCFADYAVGNYLNMLNPVKGVTVSQEDGVCEVLLTRYEYMNEFDFNEDGEFLNVPLIMELDGKLYRVAERSVVNSKFVDIDISMTRVLKRYENVILFAYICQVPYEENLIALQGDLRYIDGSWKILGTLDLPLSYNITVDALDFYQVWCGKPLEEMYIEGDYDTTELADFEYGELLENTTSYYEGAGDFLGEEYEEFRELYQSAYALTRCFEGRSAFPTAYGYEGARLMLPRKDYHNSYLQFYFTGCSADSFHDALLEIFTEEETERWFSQFYGEHHEIYIYDGAVWSFFYDGSGGDISKVHEKYDFELTEDSFDIIRTSYHTNSETGWDTDFHPELIDQYTTEEHHCIFVNTDKGWRCSQIDTIW